MIKVDGFVLGLRRLLDQLGGRGVVEIEALLDHGVELVALGLRHLAVDRRAMHQKRRRRQPVIVLAELARMLAAVDEFGDEMLERFEH